MRNIEINDIVIVGGGFSGWLSAIYLLKTFKHLNVTLIESDADVLAALLMMKRGMSIFPVASKKHDITLLQQFCPVPLTLHIFTNQHEIDTFAHTKNILAMVIGETFDNLKKHTTELLILRPLIGFDTKDITKSFIQFSNL